MNPVIIKKNKLYVYDYVTIEITSLKQRGLLELKIKLFKEYKSIVCRTNLKIQHLQNAIYIFISCRSNYNSSRNLNGSMKLTCNKTTSYRISSSTTVNMTI